MNVCRYSKPPPLENKDMINAVNYRKERKLISGSIHQGHERFLLVMTPKEDKRFVCVWLFYYVSNFCQFMNGAGCQCIDQVLLHGDHFFSACIQQQ